MASRESVARALRDLPAGIVRWASTPVEELPRVSSGLGPLDGVLGGGWPRGRLCQVRGASGRGGTSVAVAAVANSTRRGCLAAWVDGDASLDPASLRAAGADLGRVLWVRGPFSLSRTLGLVEEVLRAGGFDLVVIRPPRDRWAGDPAGWMRVARAAERSRTAILVVGRADGAQVSVDLAGASARWDGSGPGRVLDGVVLHAAGDRGEARVPLAAADGVVAGLDGRPPPARPAGTSLDLSGGPAPAPGPRRRPAVAGGRKR